MPDQRPGPCWGAVVASSSNTASACSATSIVCSVSTSGSVYRRRNACSSDSVAAGGDHRSRRGLFDRLAQHRLGIVARPANRNARPSSGRRSSLQGGSISAGPPPGAEPGSCGHIAAGEGTSPGHRQQVGRPLGRVQRVHVRGAELGRVPIALLEVIADRLLAPPALRHARRPAREALVQLGAGSLR